MKSSTTVFGVTMVNLCLVIGGTLATMDVLAQSTNVFISKIPPAAAPSTTTTTTPPSTTITPATTTSSPPLPPTNRIRIRKISTMINNNHHAQQQLHDNLIPGSSDYVPVKQSLPNIENATVVSVLPVVPKPHQVTNLTTTNSNANVFEAIPSAKHGARDPFQVNAQQQNPFMSNVGGVGGINPQIAMLLRNNPRLQMLARQNPVIAQQIMRNPQLLRNPMIQRAIQSQLSDGGGQGGGQNLLGQIGQLGLTGLNGLGRALNPLGLPIGGPLMRGNNNNNNNNAANGRNRLNQMNSNNNEGNLQNFGLPNNNHQQQNLGRRTNPHQDTLNGGYYGDNQNYNPPPPSAENNEVDDVGGQNDEENSIDPGQQDYGGGGGDNTGEENGEGGGGVGGDGDGGGNGGDDSQQNPADDPDIQQLQNFGGPMNDNFPEGLFPPGLLSKEDIQEIRRQQEKQQREDEERERQQQLQQQQYNNNNQPETSSPDYEDVNGGGGENAEENAGTEQPEEGVEAGAGGVEGGDEEVGHQDGNGNGVEPGGGMVMDHNPNHHDHNHNHHNHNDNGQNVNVYTTPMPPAYRNAYQPIQPGAHGQVPSSLMNQHGGHGPNEYQQVPQHQGPMAKNQFNLGGSNVEYEPPNHHDHTNDGGLNQRQNGYTSTFAPPNRGHYESPLRPLAPHHRGHYSPNSPLRHNGNGGDDRQSIHHPYPRPKLSQYTLGHQQISNVDGHRDRDDFPRSALYQDNDIDDGHQQRPPKTTFSSILAHQQRHPDFDRTTSKYPRPRMRLF